MTFIGVPFVPSASSPATAPDAFDVGDWSVAPGDEEAAVTINSLPSNGGASITDIEYRLDAGSWVSSGGTGNFAITGLTNDQEYDVELRAVNSVGAGAASDTKQVTPAAGGSFHPLDLSPELFFQISDLGTLKQERTGPSATTPCGVGDPVGSIQNLGTLGGWAMAEDDSRRMILRQTGGGKHYLEKGDSGSEGPVYGLSLANSVGARTSVLGLVNASGYWAATCDAGGPPASDLNAWAGNVECDAGDSRHYSRTCPDLSAGGVMSSLSGPGASPVVWLNGADIGALEDGSGRLWNSSIVALFGYAPGFSGTGTAHYFGYFSKYADMSSGDRNAVEAWIAAEMA